jgi:xanthine dehydrogenase accessory factor
MKVWPVIEQALERHGTCVLVSVVRAEGSTPREVGARMIVTPDGFHGTIGGGTLEWKALAQAQALLGRPRAVKSLTQSLGPDLGQCCGGRVTLAFEAFDAASRSEVATLAARETAGPFETMNRIAGIPYTEQFGTVRRRVTVCGAGHVGRALMLALAPLPFDVMLVDPRRDQLPPVAPANVTLSSDDPVAVVADAEAGSFVFIMSHSHTLDLAIADAALRNVAIQTVGLIGSATKRARFEKRLREAGVDEARIAAMISPIGIGGIRSKHPAAIAASVAAQILMLDEAAQASVAPETAAARVMGA